MYQPQDTFSGCRYFNPTKETIMSRSSNDYTDHMNCGGAHLSDIQPEKGHAARIERAIKFLTENGFTIIPAETTLTAN